ncbi:MAG: hypothetical protein ABS85_15390 [Sphingobacteriales bacterium SCN 48-20]|jgi:hypothetical protein|uniref:hypothetical protein n=1 Tax=Terrimonas ferruginea TaxID=249 RepID=UPI00086C9A11|nr:hypothetical protein [Terrimonas ferruginea]MBN8784948.1 hypothetical protein [Terrimonas ferruginea]ODT90427.1 MAG: hypothetical protein ABS85_15390 [Sphingobacteriales bacterium SCN 48-20]OJW44408.1 MAG: hypothetical protein BGO56_07065 [Sphingobacteriales bacterium 48-107]
MKKYVFGLGSLLLAAVLFAFTPSPKVEKASLDQGYFTRLSGDGTQPEHYEYVGNVQPSDGCVTGTVICTIKADINEMGSSDPALWLPDFSSGNPVDNESEFDLITKRAN